MKPASLLAGVHVLVAHQDRTRRTALRAFLAGAGAEVTVAAAAGTTMDRVRRDRPRVLLLDASLAERDGRDPLREIAGDPELLGTAVVLLMPGASVEDVSAALADGAVDVWDREDPTPALIAGVRAAHRSRELFDLAMSRYEDLENLAYRDELTELPNRRGSVRRLEVLLSRARRHDLRLSVMLIDADHFKTVNDRYGHAAGDDVLCALGQRLRRRVRGEDMVGRWGGEEFVVAAPDTTPAGALELAEQLRRSIARRPVDAAGRKVPLTVSIGVASLSADETLGALLDRADTALYAAKAAGRNRALLDESAPPARRASRTS